VQVVHNGVDAEAYKPTPAPDVVRSLGVDPDRPYALFVGRITRQKGVPHLLKAFEQLPPEAGLVLCAGAADTPAERQQVADAVEKLQAQRSGVIWIEQMLPRDQLVPLITGATVFVVPSVYEPLGIVNLEAMACGAAVVGTATGGIPEVVVDGVTGRLVPIDQVQDGTGTPTDPERFVADLAAVLTEVVSDPERARAYGAAGRERATNDFSWQSIADQTAALYTEVASSGR
jgi:starch synthase